MKQILLSLTLGTLLYSCNLKEPEDDYLGGWHIAHLYKDGVDVTAEVECNESNNTAGKKGCSLYLYAEGPIGSDMDYIYFSKYTFCRDTLISTFGGYSISEEKKLFNEGAYQQFPTESYGPIGAIDATWNIIQHKKNKLILETNFEENGITSFYRMELE